MAQAAEHVRLHNAVTGRQVVSLSPGRNAVLAGFRDSRTQRGHWHTWWHHQRRRHRSGGQRPSQV